MKRKTRTLSRGSKSIEIFKAFQSTFFLKNHQKIILIFSLDIKLLKEYNINRHEDYNLKTRQERKIRKMEKYNYEEAVKNDIKDWLKENGEQFKSEDGTINDDGRDEIYDILFIADSVTGNGSGSYTFNRWQAEENICHNLDLLEEALKEFCQEDVNICEKGAELADVTIRCYLLGNLIDSCIKEYNEEHEKTEEE